MQPIDTLLRRRYRITALLLLAFCLWLASFHFWQPAFCNQHSRAVHYARSLPVSRLEQLYLDMTHFAQKRDLPLLGFRPMDAIEPIPNEFADIQAISIRPDSGVITLDFCTDHGVILSFSGEQWPHNGSSAKITLHWGEHPSDSGSEVLWQSLLPVMKTINKAPSTTVSVVATL